MTVGNRNVKTVSRDGNTTCLHETPKRDDLTRRYFARSAACRASQGMADMKHMRDMSDVSDVNVICNMNNRSYSTV